MRLLFSALSGCLAVLVSVFSHESIHAQTKAAQTISELIRALGHDKPKIREAATKQLIQRDDGQAELRQATRSPDSEVARRASYILEERIRDRGEKAHTRLKKLMDQGQLSLAIDLFVHHPKWTKEDDTWRVWKHLAAELLDRTRKAIPEEFEEFAKGPHPARAPIGENEEFAQLFKPRFLAAKHFSEVQKERGVCFFVRAQRVGLPEGIGRAMFVASDSFATEGASDNVIYCGGDVRVDRIVACIVFCDGDFTAREVGACLIVARGNVKCTESGAGSRIFTGGQVQLPENFKQKTIVKEKQLKPLGLTFFEPSKMGITVEKAEGGVRVRAADQAKPFAKAGLKTGDLVLEIQGSAIDSPETFHRLVRQRMALGSPTNFSVRREKQVLNFTLEFSP